VIPIKELEPDWVQKKTKPGIFSQPDESHTEDWHPFNGSIRSAYWFAHRSHLSSSLPAFFKTVSSDHGMCMVRTCPALFLAIMHLKCMIAGNIGGCVPRIRDIDTLFLFGGGRCRADHAAATKKGLRKSRGPCL
jgi:hypothetical protein